MKKGFIVLILTSIVCSVYAQYPANIKKGAYADLTQLLKNTPTNECLFKFEKRTDFDIKMVGGNDYKVSTDNDTITRSFINKKSFAIYDGNSLYINGQFVNGRKYYCKVENNKRFLVLKAGIPTMSKYKTLGYNSDMTYAAYPQMGVVGGAIGGAQLAMIRFSYIIDCKEGTIKVLCKDYVNNLIQNNVDLKKAFDSENEKDKDNQLVLIKYIEKLNGQ